MTINQRAKDFDLSTETQPTIGILHPGMMGISVAATIQNSGYTVIWASEGRSIQTRARADEHQLVDVKTLSALCQQAQVIVSVCPPHASEALAESVIAESYQGIYIDANAIAPKKAQRIGDKLTSAGITCVDGGIIGGPAWEAGRTWLYLSGEQAERVLPYFASGPLETEAIGTDIGQASALKMCFAANTKGTTALLVAILGVSEQLGVREALEKQWTRYDDEMAERTQQRARRVTAKAWRFAGEMTEIAETFASVDLPDGFHLAARDIYERLAGFKDRPEVPELDEVLDSLRSSDDRD